MVHRCLWVHLPDKQCWGKASGSQTSPLTLIEEGRSHALVLESLQNLANLPSSSKMSSSGISPRRIFSCWFTVPAACIVSLWTSSWTKLPETSNTCCRYDGCDHRGMDAACAWWPSSCEHGCCGKRMRGQHGRDDRAGMHCWGPADGICVIVWETDALIAGE